MASGGERAEKSGALSVPKERPHDSYIGDFFFGRGSKKQLVVNEIEPLSNAEGQGKQADEAVVLPITLSRGFGVGSW